MESRVEHPSSSHTRCEPNLGTAPCLELDPMEVGPRVFAFLVMRRRSDWDRRRCSLGNPQHSSVTTADLPADSGIRSREGRVADHRSVALREPQARRLMSGSLTGGPGPKMPPAPHNRSAGSTSEAGRKPAHGRACRRDPGSPRGNQAWDAPSECEGSRRRKARRARQASSSCRSTCWSRREALSARASSVSPMSSSWTGSSGRDKGKTPRASRSALARCERAYRASSSVASRSPISSKSSAALNRRFARRSFGSALGHGAIAISSSLSAVQSCRPLRGLPKRRAH